MKLNMNTNEMITKTAIKETVKKLQAEEISKGECIRTLFAGGLSVKEISDITTIKYNHVYNVCRNEVYRNHLEGDLITAREGGTKKQTILEKLQGGMSITEVSRELGCLYNQVWQIAKANGLTPKQLKAQEVK